jgi:hypothetical protein
MTEPTPCPVCNELVAAERLQAHCDSHFPSQEEPADSQTCSICNQRVRADDYDSHQYAHRRATLGVAQTLISSVWWLHECVLVKRDRARPAVAGGACDSQADGGTFLLIGPRAPNGAAGWRRKSRMRRASTLHRRTPALSASMLLCGRALASACAALSHAHCWTRADQLASLPLQHTSRLLLPLAQCKLSRSRVCAAAARQMPPVRRAWALEAVMSQKSRVRSPLLTHRQLLWP